MRYHPLTRNNEFARAYTRGKSFVHPHVVLYVNKNRLGRTRVGITASKKIGNAVTRNRARRVLRAALYEVLPPDVGGYDLVLVARGMTNDEIGAELFISPATVKTHLARIMAKLGAHDRAQLVVRAYEGGLVRPGARGEGPLAQPRPTISPTPRGQFCAKAQKLSGVHRTNCGDCAKPQSRALRFPQFRLHSLTRLL